MPPNGHIANREVIGMKSEHLFEYLAKQRGISVPELRKLISIRIESGIPRLRLHEPSDIMALSQ